MTVNELLKNVQQLDLKDFEELLKKIQQLRSKMLPEGMTSKEKELIKKINAPFPQVKKMRLDYLIARRDTHTLTEEQYQELLGLTETFEQYELRRLKLLSKLADINNISLPEVIRSYKIKPLPNG